MFSQPIQFDKITISLLEKIFLNNLSGSGALSVKKFRVLNHEQMGLLDSLEQGSYISQLGNTYCLRIDTLFDIAGTQTEAKKCIDLCRQIFLLLQHEYKEDPEKNLSLSYLAKKSGMPRQELNAVLNYLIEAPDIIGSRTTTPSQQDAYVYPLESILRHKSLDQVIEKMRDWRKPVEFEEESIKKMLFDSREIGDFSFLLHVEIIKHALDKYNDGHLRSAVLDSMIAVFEFIRARTGIRDEDGDRLIGKVFSLEAPYLILSEIDTESGKNDQKGFMQIFKGVYQGIRNPKAHKLDTDLTKLKAAQYLVFASMLIRRIEEAKIVRQDQE